MDWEAASTAYTGLTLNTQTLLKNHAADSTYIGQALQRYDYIVSKYDGSGLFPNFMDRNVVPNPGSKIVEPIEGPSQGLLIVLAVILLAGVSGSVFFALRSKRHG